MLRRLTRFLLPALLAVGGCSPRQPSAPDVVLITVDALRADILSSAGYPRPTSPRLDALADEGVAFSQALTSFPGTAPAMPSLMSGLFPSFEGVAQWTATTRHGFNDLEAAGEREREGLSDNLVMLAEVLRAAGYTTLGFNTNPHLGTRTNFHQGFDEYELFIPYLDGVRATRAHPLLGAYPPADIVVSGVLRRLEQGVGRPLFLWVHLMDPHSPYLPPERFASLFRPSGATLSDLELNESVYHLLYRQQGSLRAAERYPSPEARGLSREELIAHLRGLYEAEVRFADDELGRLFAGLRARPRWRDTLVLVTADHGEELLDHGHVAHHELTGLAEELIRIPAILKPPGGRPPVRRVAELVRMVDFAPTILDYCGLAEAAGAMDGLSLRPLVEGRPMPPRTAFFSTIRYGVARDAHWKYRLEKHPQGGGAAGERLFDIVADPQERDDLAARNPEVVAEMRARYLDFVRHLEARASTGSAATAGDGSASTAEDAEERRRLEALGYLEQ